MSITFNILKGGSVNAGGNPAAVYQGERVHEELLDPRTLPEYPIVANMPPGPMKEAAMEELKAQAIVREASDPRYFEDQVPRRTIPMSSSWVGPIQYDPKSKIMIALNRARVVEPDQMTRILNGEDFDRKPGSIGSAISKILSGK